MPSSWSSWVDALPTSRRPSNPSGARSRPSSCAARRAPSRTTRPAGASGWHPSQRPLRRDGSETLLHGRSPPGAATSPRGFRSPRAMRSSARRRRARARSVKAPSSIASMARSKPRSNRERTVPSSPFTPSKRASWGTASTVASTSSGRSPTMASPTPVYPGPRTTPSSMETTSGRSPSKLASTLEGMERGDT